MKDNFKWYIGLIVILFIFVFIVIIINKKRTEMHFDINNKSVDEVNEFLDILQSNLDKNGVNYKVEKSKNKDTYSMLVYTYNDYINEYMSYNIDLKTGKQLNYEEVAEKFGLTIDDIHNKIKERFEKYYNEEKKQGYVDSNECDFECYKSFYRKIEDIEYCYTLYIKNNKLYIYLNFGFNSMVDDKDYFKELKYNPYVIEV